MSLPEPAAVPEPAVPSPLSVPEPPSTSAVHEPALVVPIAAAQSARSASTPVPATEVRDVLRLEGVSLRYGGVQALDDVSITARAGEVHGLIGPNGAGKTSLFNVATGLVRPGSGKVLLGGADVTPRAPHRRARLGMARTFQRLELFSSLTVTDNVLVAAESMRVLPWRGAGDLRRAEAAMERTGLREVAGERVDTLPTGTARLVELARALAGSPRVLLLDEPASGLDEAETAALAAVLRDLAREGMAVLLVEHDMSLVMDVCDVVEVMDRGRVIAGGEPAEIQASALVREAYLGPDAATDEGAP